MKISDIETLKITDAMPPHGKRIRANAPKLVASVINDTDALTRVDSIKALRPEHLQALSGGVDAATYLVNVPRERVVIKLSYHGVDAEAETLQAWRKRHVRAPRIIKTGTVPCTKHLKQPVKFMVQQALVDGEGRLIETCAAYLVHAPEQARHIGRALGRQLARIHSSVSARQFGEFKDASGNRSGYKTWNEYMLDALEPQKAYLRSKIGLSKADIEAVELAFKQRRYVKKGRYLHGDFSVRNVAVKSYEPIKVSIFDPNPIIGDPSWDICFLRNNYEFEKRRMKYDESQRDLYTRNQQIWVGFKQEYDRVINHDNLLTAQFIQAIYQAQYQEGIGDKLAFRARKEFLHDAARELAALTKRR